MQMTDMNRRLQNTGVDTRQHKARQVDSQPNQNNQLGISACFQRKYW
jgi:hypothetical protein